ncbi:methylenetetrahydrofolate reductase [Amycolatopsis solani]|uniref:methylenetetrahydrofolate reductase n=1 Tax=Amycolatopsis solani TaxID=3028615 RepID=UPI00296E2D5D|nr:methylenetetrahydrofolate reductase [Amycolatopsis sp. MEP2-6]
MSNFAELVRNISYEVMPLRGTEDAVLADVPADVPLTVTVTESKGLDATLELSERLHGHGYAVAPHLAARQFADARHVEDVVARLREAGLRSVVVVGGDAPRPAGPFPDAFTLLQTMEALGHPFDRIGVGGYPEGHATIPRDALDLALKQKAPLATHVISQICFSAATTSSWAAGVVGLPVYVGLPGPVNRQRLVRISANIGLGRSARFVRKQRGLLWRLLLPRGYRPTPLVRRLGARAPANVAGLHIFTFNELRRTEAWRQRLLATVTS